MSVSLRPATTDDRSFLARVYASTREEELAQVPFTPEQRSAFLAQQFAAQSMHYELHHADASFDVLLVDGEAAGRLVVDRRDDRILLVDIALLPRFRGRGIGTRLLQTVLDEGARTGRTVDAHVRSDNPARRLYRRLGFRELSADAVDVAIEWIPPTERSRR